MRAPPLARMADVAAPRPDAEPVTITHKPSFDIRVSLISILSARWRAIIIPCRQTHANPPNLRCAELIIPRLAFMSPLQAALRRQALVMAMAFPHHPVQDKKSRKRLHRTLERNGPVRLAAK